MTSPVEHRSSPLAQGLAVCGLLLVGAVLGAGAMLSRQRPAAEVSTGAVDAPKYHCPMHPTYTSATASDCPICGMRLTAIADDAGQLPDENTAVVGLSSVHWTPTQERLANVGLATAVTGDVGMPTLAHARLVVDETRVHQVTVKAEAYIEAVHVGVVGEQVRQGQALVTLYSPELYRAQLEFMASRQAGALIGSGTELAAQNGERLRLAGVPSTVVNALLHGGKPQRTLTLTAPIAGTLTTRNLTPGARMMPGDVLCEVTDLTQLWAVADLHTADMADVRVGMGATVRTVALPDLPVQTTVTVIDPAVDPLTRALRVRMPVPNPTLRLKPEMFATVTWSMPTHEGVLVPSDAVLDAGEDAQGLPLNYVFLATDRAGVYVPQAVQTGMRVGDQVEITRGLGEGHVVVAHAVFLLDADSRLHAALRAMQAAP